jgi:replicative DNA helicase
MSETPTSKAAIQDYAAERAVLGGILADKRKIADVATLVRRDDFFYPPHGEIFDACVALDLNNKPVDSLTLAEELKVRGTLQQVGGLAYLVELDTAAPTAANATEYARIVADKALRRRLLDASRSLVDLSSKEEGTVEELLDEAQKRIFAIGEERVVGEPKRINEVMEKTLDLLDKLRTTQGGITGLATGFIDLDKQLTGLHEGELIILAARPGVGKTSLALNMGVHAALKEKRAVAVFSLEMPSDQLALRLLSSEAKVSLKKLREGGLTDHDMSKINTAAADLYGAPIYIDDSGALTSFDLRAKARRLKQKDKSLSLIIIDYLQLMTAGGRTDSREQEVAQISRSLKQLAKELTLPIIALSQLNRKVEERKDGRPMLSDLRESGSIEQDADVVMFIHPEQDEGGDGGGGLPGTLPIELIVAKQRNGPTGEIPLILLQEFTKFENRARGENS